MLNQTLLYVEHLSDRDLELIARAVDSDRAPDRMRSWLREHPSDAEEAIASESLYELVLGKESTDTIFEVGATPFLVFGVLVNKVARDLSATTFVPEWVGSGQRLPVFGVESMREFVEDGLRRFFLIEFLASFTKIASGSVWVRTRRGYRRRRFSELDPVGLAEMVEGLPAAQRAAGYRRLGDVSLFLSGVFPDHTTRHALGAAARERLARSAGIDAHEVDDTDEIRFFEMTGSRWYDRAVDSATEITGVGPEYLRDVAGRFSDARRLLNYLSDRYLYQLDTGLMHPAS